MYNSNYLGELKLELLNARNQAEKITINTIKRLDNSKFLSMVNVEINNMYKCVLKDKDFQKIEKELVAVKAS